MRRAVCGWLLIVCVSGWGQDQHPVSGRRYAGVMGGGGGDGLVRPEGEAEDPPDAALDAIGIAKGATAADIGAGAGYFTWRLAGGVGPSGMGGADGTQRDMS